MEKMRPHRAREWMLTAKVFNAKEARRAGLVHFEGFLTEIDEDLDKNIVLIKKANPVAIAETKKLLHFLASNAHDKYREQCTKVIAERRVSPEGQAGLKAFLEKKPAPWAK